MVRTFRKQMQVLGLLGMTLATVARTEEATLKSMPTDPNALWHMADRQDATGKHPLIIHGDVQFGVALEGADSETASAAISSLSVLSVVGFIAAGLVAGSLAALLGIGGGIIYVPALVTIFGFAQHEAQATSLVVIVPTTVVAAWVHARAGRVDWPRAFALGSGGLIGGALGAWSALAIDGLVLRRLFAGILVFVAYRMISRARKSVSPA